VEEGERWSKQSQAASHSLGGWSSLLSLLLQQHALAGVTGWLLVMLYPVAWC